MVETLTESLSQTNVRNIRNWKLYNVFRAQINMASGISGLDAPCEFCNVQDYWNALENVLITVIVHSQNQNYKRQASFTPK